MLISIYEGDCLFYLSGGVSFFFSLHNQRRVIHNVPNYILYAVVSGVVSDMGPLAREKSGLKEGDKVMALIGGGGYAGTETKFPGPH